MAKKVEIDKDELDRLKLTSWRYEQIRSAACVGDDEFIDKFKEVVGESESNIQFSLFDYGVDVAGGRRWDGNDKF